MEQRESLFARVKQCRGIGWVLALAAIGILLILFGGSARKSVSESGKSAEEESYYSVRFYTEDLEKRIAALCEQVEGVSCAHVLLTLDGGTEYVYAENETGSARDYVIIENGSNGAPVLIQEIYPEIRGVAVVCTRGSDSEVQRIITELLAAALGLPTSRIRVAGAE